MRKDALLDVVRGANELPASISRFTGQVVPLRDVIAARRHDLRDNEGMIGPLEQYPLVHELSDQETNSVFGRKIPWPAFDAVEAGKPVIPELIKPWVKLLTGQHRSEQIAARKRLMGEYQAIAFSDQLTEPTTATFELEGLLP